MRSHLSSGDGCHPNSGCCVFTCPHSVDISWTLTDGEGKTWLYLLLKNSAYFSLTYSCFWATGLPKRRISPVCRACATSSRLFNHLLCFTRGSNWPDSATGVASVVPDYPPAWWGWALTPPRRSHMRDACSRCSCPLQVALWGGSLALPPWKAHWDRSRRLLLMKWSLPRLAGLSAYVFLHEIIHERDGSRPANKASLPAFDLF